MLYKDSTLENIPTKNDKNPSLLLGAIAIAPNNCNCAQQLQGANNCTQRKNKGIKVIFIKNQVENSPSCNRTLVELTVG